MKIIFIGTPDFAQRILATILRGGHEVPCVYTQPPRPAGRGKKLRKSPVHDYAQMQGIEVRTPETLRDERQQDAFKALFEKAGAEIAIVVAYGLILPLSLLNIPAHGCVNIHASLLPRWRGAAPIQRAILAGDQETGISIMQMEEGLDTGAVIKKQALTIAPYMNAGHLHDKLADIGGHLILEILRELQTKKLKLQPQNHTRASYAPKIKKSEAHLNWLQPAITLDRQIRGLTPWPGCFFMTLSGRVKVLEAHPVSVSPTYSYRPGTVLDEEKAIIACGTDGIQLLKLQKAGKNPVSGPEFIRGQALKKGDLIFID